MNSTEYETTNFPFESTEGFYTTSDYNATEKILPFFNRTQSYITCGKNIKLQDSLYLSTYAQFDIDHRIPSAIISFTVCKDESFHYLDRLSLWYGQPGNWYNTSLSPPEWGIDCITFSFPNQSWDVYTYFIGLSRFYPNQYGLYTIYMQCESDIYPDFHDVTDNFINTNITSSNSAYNEYIEKEFPYDNIGGISCDIILTNSLSRTEWFAAINKREYYEFTVKKLTDWIKLSTCDNTDRIHTLELYYPPVNDTLSDWNIRSVSVTSDSCPILRRSYLIPGKYYVGIDVTNLLYNEYTIAMECSSNDSIVVVTDYEAYVGKPTPEPTVASPVAFEPTLSPINADSSTTKESDNGGVIALIVILIIVIIGFIIGIYFGYVRYKRRHEKRERVGNKHKSKHRNKHRKEHKNKHRSKSKKKDIVDDAMRLEMVSSGGNPNNDENQDDEDDSSDVQDENDMDNHDSLSDLSKPQEEQQEEEEEDDFAIKAGPSEGDVIAAKGYSEGGIISGAGEGDPFINEDEKENKENVDETAPPAAWGNFDFNAVPPIIETPGGDGIAGGAVVALDSTFNDIPIINYDSAAVDGAENEQHDEEEDEEEFEEEESSEEIIVEIEQLELKVDSYVFVDCNTVYGIITDILQYDYFMIIDFFEGRKRKAHRRTLKLIQDKRILAKAKRQHKRYQKKKRKKSSGKKRNGKK